MKIIVTFPTVDLNVYEPTVFIDVMDKFGKAIPGAPRRLTFLSDDDLSDLNDQVLGHLRHLRNVYVEDAAEKREKLIEQLGNMTTVVKTSRG